MHDEVKAYLSYTDQVVLLEQRGMDVGDHHDAARVLRRINYYRLSGYWYPFREQRTDEGRGDTFYQGTRLADVVALYEFDASLRTVTFSTLAPVELALRALLGHELGQIDPCVHLDPDKLGPTARQGLSYDHWRKDYEDELKTSREDFAVHHHHKYGGRLPVWAAVELLSWGGLTRLYRFAPRPTQDAIAGMCGLTAPQLSSWLKALNILRNICAHHGRLYNRVHTLSPKLPPAGMHPDLHAATTVWTRTFGQLTLIQFLLDRLEVGSRRRLPLVVKTYPEVSMIPQLHLGAEPNWQTRSRLWSV